MNRARAIFRRVDGTLRPGWRLAVYLAALFTSSFAVGRLYRLSGLGRSIQDGVVQPWPMLFRGSAILLATLAVTAAMMWWLERRPLGTLGVPLRGPWMRGFGAGFVIGALPVALLLGSLWVSGHAEVGWSLRAADSGAMAALLAGGVGLACLSWLEEFVFRGYPLQLLAEGLGPAAAALITGSLFGLAHAGNPGSDPVGLVNTAVNAIVLTVLIYRTGSLWIALGDHFGWNAMGGLVFGATVSGIAPSGSLLSTELTGPAWLTGGAYGYEASALAGPLELAVLLVALAIASRLPGHPELRRYFRRAARVAQLVDNDAAPERSVAGG